MKLFVKLLLCTLSCVFISSCSRSHKIIYYTYNKYNETTKVYASAGENSTVLAELPSPSNQLEVDDKKFDVNSTFTRVTTAKGITGYIATKYIRRDFEGGRYVSWGGQSTWVRDKYAFEKTMEAGSYTVGNILFFMKNITFHKHNFDEGTWSWILLGLGLAALLINCLGWFGVELGTTAYWILNFIYWLLYLGILFSEFVVFAMHSPFDFSESSGSDSGTPVLVQIILGLIFLFTLIYTIVLSVVGSANMLGSLVPQGAFGKDGNSVVILNMLLSYFFMIAEGIVIWLIPSFADKLLFGWLILQGIIVLSFLITSLISGRFGTLITTLLYAILFPIVFFIIMNAAVTLGLLLMGLAIIISIPFAPLFAPVSEAPTGFVLRDSSGRVVDEIDTYGNSRTSYRRYSSNDGGRFWDLID